MNPFYKRLKKLVVDTRKANTEFFTANQGDPRTNPAFTEIWERYTDGVSAIRGEIAGAVSENLLDKSALSKFDDLTAALDVLSCRSGMDWTDAPHLGALLGAEAIIEAAPAL